MVGSFRETVRIWVDQTVSSDLWLRPAKALSNSSDALFPAAAGDEVERMPFVAAIDRVRGRDVLYGDTMIWVGSGEFDVVGRIGNLPMAGRKSSTDSLTEALESDGVVVSESFSNKHRKGIGDIVALPVLDGVRRFPITGIYRDYSNDRGVVVMDRRLYIRSYADDAINTIVVYLKPGVDRERARAQLEATFGPKYGAFAAANASIRNEVMTIFDQTFLITYALLAIAVAVAVLGIINTLAALILERARELALLRVGGMSAGQVRTMIVLESSLMALASTAAGVAMGYILSWILIHVINKQSFGWTIDFHAPVALIAGSLAVTVVAATLAGLVPARLANTMRFPAAIKSE
jgi:putative ABC transport system permease protein